MSIVSNANPQEKSSPFYEANKDFCEVFKSFVDSKKGISTGTFNAWSYLIKGKINEPYQWVLEYKKSTFSSGNLLFSSKAQNLFVSALWKTRTHNYSTFVIRKKKLLDPFLKLFNHGISNLENFESYTLISKTQSLHIAQLVSILRPLLNSGKVYQISSMDNTLKIELRTEQHYFDIFKQLLKFKFED